MLSYILADIICQTFGATVGKWQDEKDQRCFVVDFSISPNHDVESGYRNLELLIYAPHNYVMVAFRERWNVIPLEDLEDDGHGDMAVKKGKDYDKGAGPWNVLSYHDSCWRHDGVQGFLSEFGKKLNTLGFIGNWYEIHRLDDPKNGLDLDREGIRKLLER